MRAPILSFPLPTEVNPEHCPTPHRRVPTVVQSPLDSFTGRLTRIQAASEAELAVSMRLLARTWLCRRMSALQVLLQVGQGRLVPSA